MYRERRRGCPTCGGAMERRPLPHAAGPEAALDHCERCRGVFLDYFDGEPSAVARGMRRAGQVSGQTKTPEREPVCPDCDVPLRLLPYQDHLALWRCESCAGAFLTPGMLRALADYRWHEQQPPSLLDRLLAWWRVLPHEQDG